MAGMAGAAATGAGQALAAPQQRLLDEAIDAAVAEQRVVGAVVLVAHDGVLLYRRAAGLADRERGRPMTVETPFRLSSLTKPFTTVAAVKLIEAGVLSADDPVTRWLPGFEPPHASGAPILIGHLMAHLAGLDYGFQQGPDGAYRRAGISDGLDESLVSLAENLRRIASVPLDREPGSAWRYSVATDVLGAVVSAASDMPLDAAIDRLVVRPLRLNASFHWPTDDLAVPYRDGANGPVRMEGVTQVPMPGSAGPGVRFDPDRIRRSAAFPSGGAGMAGRAGDMLELLEACRAGSFLPEVFRRNLRTARVGADAQTQGPGWGYSWLGSVLVEPAAAGSSLSKGSVSWGGVYGHMWAIDFRRRLTVVAMTNTAFEGMFGRFPKDVIAALREPGTAHNASDRGSVRSDPRLSSGLWRGEPAQAWPQSPGVTVAWRNVSEPGPRASTARREDRRIQTDGDEG